MKVKYKKSMIWFALAIIWFGMTIFLYQKYIPSAPEESLVRQFVALVVVPALVGVYYLLMPMINYCTLTDTHIKIHKSAIIIQQKIAKEKLDYCRVTGRDLEFVLKDGKIYGLHLDWCIKAEAIQLVKKLQSFTMVYDGHTTRSIDLKDIDVLA